MADKPTYYRALPKRTKRLEKPRESRSVRGYTRAWYRLRAMILNESPLCLHCLSVGRTTPATEVDHITPIRAGGSNARSNLQPLCKPCHSRKTATESGGDRGVKT